MLFDEGIPLRSTTPNESTKSHAQFDEGIPLLDGAFCNAKLKNKVRPIIPRNKHLLFFLLTMTNGACAFPSTENNLSDIQIMPAIITWHRPLNITVPFDGMTCEDDLHWLQVSDKSKDFLIARNNVSYNPIDYNAYVDYSEHYTTYILQIKNVTSKDLQMEYRVECRTKTTNVKLLEMTKLILKPERMTESFQIENGILIGNMNLFNMYPYPTGYFITFQTPEGYNMTFDRHFLNGSDNYVHNLINKTYAVRETIGKNICSGNVSVTIYVRDRVIATFCYQIFSNCSTGTADDARNSATLIIIVTVIVVLGVVIIVLVCIFRPKLKHNCGKLIETSCSYMSKPCRDEDEDDGYSREIEEKRSFIEVV